MVYRFFNVYFAVKKDVDCCWQMLFPSVKGEGVLKIASGSGRVYSLPIQGADQSSAALKSVYLTVLNSSV